MMASNANAVEERSLFPNGPLVLFLGSASHQDRSIVPQNSSKDLTTSIVS